MSLSDALLIAESLNQGDFHVLSHSTYHMYQDFQNITQEFTIFRQYSVTLNWHRHDPYSFV